MHIEAVEELVGTLERDVGLDAPLAFAARHAARAELALGAEVLAHRRADPRGDALLRRLEALVGRIERTDAELFAGLRDEIREGSMTPVSLREWLEPLTAYVPSASSHAHVAEEPLDAFVDRLLGLPRVKETGLAPGEDLIHYEPAPASLVLDLVDHGALEPDDVVCDVGAGIGRIPLLLHLLTGRPTRGVELDPGLAAIGARAARELELRDVEIVAGDARTADFRGASVFVLVTPFRGKVLEEVLSRLREASSPAPPKLVSFGPGTPWIARLPGLELVSGDADDEFRIARFVARG